MVFLEKKISMKFFLLSLLMVVGCVFTLSAQKGQPSFGKIDLADLEMKDCNFDKRADALVLIDYGKTFYDRGTVGYSLFKTIYERRTRIKILKEKGLSEANMEIPFYNHNNEERVFKLEANTYNIDANGKVYTTEVKKSNIYTKKIDAYYSKIIFAFPEVKVGSVIELRYSIERETMGNLRNWYFQKNIPVRYSEYLLTIPQIFKFSLQPYVEDSIQSKQDIIDEFITANNGAVVQTKSLKSDYIMQNLPGVKSEAYMGAAKDYMQRLEFQLTQVNYESYTEDISLKWENVIKNLMTDNDFGLQLQKNIIGASSLVNEAKQISDQKERIKFIYNRLRKELNWNGDEDIYTDAGISNTWDTKTGNTADINLLLINLLNASGIKAIPVLFSTRQNGLVATNYPSANQFNVVMAYMSVQNKILVLDATDKISNYQLVPRSVSNTNGFIVEGELGRWKEFLSGKQKYKVMTAIRGEIDEKGVMKGNGVVNSYDYARSEHCKEWLADKIKFKEDHFSKPFPAVKIDDFSVNNVNADSLPLEQNVNFNTTVNAAGEYKYFSLNTFSSLVNNPFISEKRVSDIDFGVPQDYTIFGNYTIPIDYTFDGVPENISMTTPDNGVTFSRICSVESNLLNVRINIQFNRSFYPVSAYPDFREFYKKMLDKLSEQVVIKKKVTP